MITRLELRKSLCVIPMLLLMTVAAAGTYAEIFIQVVEDWVFKHETDGAPRY